jgi:HSP20 family protein
MSYPRRSTHGWDPFSELQALRAELGRMVGSALVGGPGSTADVDIDRTESGWTVTARLPGVAPEEVVVDFEERELFIRARSEAEVNEQQVGEATGSRRRSFEYRVAIAGDVDPDGIDATMDHGLLTVRLPRVARSQRRQIAVARGVARTDPPPAPGQDQPKGA